MAAPARFRAYVLTKARQNLALNDYEAAFSHYLLAIKIMQQESAEIRDEFVYCMCQWTHLLKRLERQDDVDAAFSQARAVCRFSDSLMCSLGEQALRLEKISTAVSLIQEAELLFPHSLSVQESMEHVCYSAVERWHFKMLNDLHRNKAYRDAILRTIQECNVSSVLDIGCGTGLLSLFAVKGGVQHVTMCDASSVMIEICSLVMTTYCRQSQSPSQLHIFDGRSTSLSVPKHVPERVDLVVTEIFDAALFGEHCLSSLSHAWSYLLHNSENRRGRVIPAAAEVYVCAIECPEIRKENCVHPAILSQLGLSDISIISRTSVAEGEPYTTEDLYCIRNSYRFLSPIHTLMTVDFNDPKALETFSSHSSKVMLDIYAEGTVDALVVWFDLELCKGVKVSTAPSDACCWEQAIFPVMSKRHGSNKCVGTGFPASPKVNCGDQLKVNCQLIDGCLQLRLDEIMALGYFLNSCHISPQASPAVDRLECAAGGEDRQGFNHNSQTAPRDPMATERTETEHQQKLARMSSSTVVNGGEESRLSVGQSFVSYKTDSDVSERDSKITLSAMCLNTTTEKETQQTSCVQDTYNSLKADEVPVNTIGTDFPSPCKMQTENNCKSQAKTGPQKSSDVFIDGAGLLQSGSIVETGCKNLWQCQTCSDTEGVDPETSAVTKRPCHSLLELSTGCGSRIRKEKDTTDSSASDYADSPIHANNSSESNLLNCQERLGITSHNDKSVDLHSNTYAAYLHREEIRHLNDHKYNSLYFSAMQHARTCVQCTERLISISGGPPVQGILGLKLGFQIADLCYVGPSEKQEIESLTESIRQRSCVSGSRWNWWEGPVEDVVEGYEDGMEVDLVLLDVVEMTGVLREGLVNELRALRPVLREGAVMVPQVVDVYAVLIDSPQLLSMSCVTGDENTLGFGITPHINPFRTRTFLDLDIHALPHQNLSDVAHVFRLDIQSCMTIHTSIPSTEQPDNTSTKSTLADKEGETLLDSAFSQTKQLCFTACKSGSVTGVVYWFDLTLAPRISASTVDPEMNWRQAAYVLNGGKVEEGQEVMVEARLGKSYLHFSLGCGVDD